jgi:hypothetical protein
MAMLGSTERKAREDAQMNAMTTNRGHLSGGVLLLTAGLLGRRLPLRLRHFMLDRVEGLDRGL